MLLKTKMKDEWCGFLCLFFIFFSRRFFFLEKKVLTLIISEVKEKFITGEKSWHVLFSWRQHRHRKKILVMEFFFFGDFCLSLEKYRNFFWSRAQVYPVLLLLPRLKQDWRMGSGRQLGFSLFFCLDILFSPGVNKEWKLKRSIFSWRKKNILLVVCWSNITFFLLLSSSAYLKLCVGFFGGRFFVKKIFIFFGWE